MGLSRVSARILRIDRRFAEMPGGASQGTPGNVFTYIESTHIVRGHILSAHRLRWQACRLGFSPAYLFMCDGPDPTTHAVGNIALLVPFMMLMNQF